MTLAELPERKTLTKCFEAEAALLFSYHQAWMRGVTYFNPAINFPCSISPRGADSRTSGCKCTLAKLVGQACVNDLQP